MIDILIRTFFNKYPVLLAAGSTVAVFGLITWFSYQYFRADGGSSASNSGQEEQVKLSSNVAIEGPPENFFPDLDAENVQMVQSDDNLPGSVDDVFAYVQPVSLESFDRTEKAKRRFYAKREAGLDDGGELILVSYTNDGEVTYQRESLVQFQNMDKDFSAHKQPTSYPTKPVDLSRVLPMTEIIPAVLLDEIKSELQGEVVRARIPQHVYSYHDRNILIPKGSIAMGRYKPLGKAGDTRLDIEFYRIVTPDGINIKVSGSAADQEGSQGLTGELDNKNFEKFGTASIAAMLQAGAQLSVDVENNNQRAAADSVSQPLNEVIAQILSESINIAPTVRIAKGTAFNIKFKSDIWFAETVGNKIVTVALE